MTTLKSCESSKTQKAVRLTSWLKTSSKVSSTTITQLLTGLSPTSTGSKITDTFWISSTLRLTNCNSSCLNTRIFWWSRKMKRSKTRRSMFFGREWRRNKALSLYLLSLIHYQLFPVFYWSRFFSMLLTELFSCGKLEVKGKSVKVASWNPIIPRIVTPITDNPGLIQVSNWSIAPLLSILPISIGARILFHWSLGPLTDDSSNLREWIRKCVDLRRIFSAHFIRNRFASASQNRRAKNTANHDACVYEVLPARIEFYPEAKKDG